MKKTLIAMAVLAAASAASAQSSVTLYGRLDLGLTTTTTKNTLNNGTPAKTTATSLFGAQDQYTSSRLGVTGTEDLGGGKTAFFTYEFGLNAEGDAAVGSTRVANIGVQGGFGSIAIGTQYNAIDDARSLGNAGSTNFADAFSEGYDGSVADAGGLFGVAGFPDSFTGDAAGHIGGRSSNSLQYSSPSVGGVTAVVTVGSETKKDTSSAGIATNTKSTQAIVGVRYSGHGLSAQLAYGNARTESPAVAAVGATATNLAANAVTASKVNGNDFIAVASYTVNFGSVSASPRVIYEGSKGKDSARNITNKRTFVGVGSGFEIGAFGPWISFGYGKLKTNALVGSDVKASESGVEVGTTYTMSKRTSMYAFYNAARERVKVNGVRVGKVTRNGLAVGLVHKF